MKATLVAIFAVLPIVSAGQQPQNSAPGPQLESVPSPAQVQALLESDDLKSKAWGAWWTAQAQITGMEPLLQKNLEDHYQGKTSLDEAVMDQTLDAYIQSSGSLPPVDLLKAVYPRRPSQTLILFSRMAPSPSVDKALLELLPTEEGIGSGVEWYAMADLLLAHRAQGFAASLLREIKVVGYFSVCDPGDCEKTGLGMAAAMSVGGEGMLAANPVPGTPPWPIYTLQPIFENPAIPSRSSTIVVSGPVSIGYHRRVGAAGYSPSEMQSSHGWQRRPIIPTTGDRLKYLKALSTFGNPIMESEYRSIPWMGADNFIAAVNRFREDIRQRHANLVQQLQASRLLSAQEAASVPEPVIEISISDVRTVKTPLPDISGR